MYRLALSHGKNWQEMTVYPDKTGTVASIIEEAKREFKFAPGGTGVLRYELKDKSSSCRLVFVGTSPNCMRVYNIFQPDVSVNEVYSKIATPTVYTVSTAHISILVLGKFLILYTRVFPNL